MDPFGFKTGKEELVCRADSQRRYDIQVTDIKQSDTRQNSNAMQQKDEHELNSKYFEGGDSRFR